MQIENNERIVFDTGKEIYADQGIIGLDVNNLHIYDGYHGLIWCDSFLGKNQKKFLTQEERGELADYMINKWTEFKGNYSPRVKIEYVVRRTTTLSTHDAHIDNDKEKAKHAYDELESKENERQCNHHIPNPGIPDVHELIKRTTTEIDYEFQDDDKSDNWYLQRLTPEYEQWENIMPSYIKGVGWIENRNISEIKKLRDEHISHSPEYKYRIVKILVYEERA